MKFRTMKIFKVLPSFLPVPHCSQPSFPSFTFYNRITPLHTTLPILPSLFVIQQTNVNVMKDLILTCFHTFHCWGAILSRTRMIWISSMKLDKISLCVKSKLGRYAITKLHQIMSQTFNLFLMSIVQWEFLYSPSLWLLFIAHSYSLLPILISYPISLSY